MVTILNGKLTIPEHERFIGFAGDNLVRKVRFLFEGKKETDLIYRIYLTFDNGSVNYFTLPCELTDEGVVLEWTIRKEHIFQSGNILAQIKVFSTNGVIAYTTKDYFIVGNSAEFSDYLHDNNTEFLEYEKKLNELNLMFQETRVLMPYIGNNGNWYIFDSTRGEYVDSTKPSVGKAESTDIENGAVTGDKLAAGAIDRKDIFSQEMQNMYMSLPMYKVEVTGDINDDFYNQYLTPGIYQLDSLSGKHQVLVVMKPDSSAYLMQMLLCYDKIMYRGIFCSVEGIFAPDDWNPWVNLCECGMKKADKFGVPLTIGDDIDPYLLAYQTDDPTTEKHLRIPLSMIKERIMSITDTGEYFVSQTVEGALQELGAELQGVSELLAQI